MRSDIIVHHEHWQALPMETFVAQLWRKAGLGRLPTETRGIVSAYINHGRWIVDCPARCGSAMVVSETDPRFLCVVCGNPENDAWYGVAFPADKADIEAELLKRPARDGFQAASRNWSPTETVADLRRENAEHALGGR